LDGVGALGNGQRGEKKDVAVLIAAGIDVRVSAVRPERAGTIHRGVRGKRAGVEERVCPHED
jgi:hypothetical protein